MNIKLPALSIGQTLVNPVLSGLDNIQTELEQNSEQRIKASLCRSVSVRLLTKRAIHRSVAVRWCRPVADSMHRNKPSSTWEPAL